MFILGHEILDVGIKGVGNLGEMKVRFLETGMKNMGRRDFLGIILKIIYDLEKKTPNIEKKSKRKIISTQGKPMTVLGFGHQLLWPPSLPSPKPLLPRS